MIKWSSDTNYPAGSDPWSATPTKVTPSDGEITAGHTPGVPPDAQVENWWKNRVDTAIESISSVASFYPAYSYKSTAAGSGHYKVTPGSATVRNCLSTGLANGAHEIVIPIEGRFGLEITQVVISTNIAMGGAETATLKLEKTFADGTADSTLSTKTWAAADNNGFGVFADKTFTITPGADDGSFNLQLRLTLTTADAGGGLATSLVSLARYLVTYSG